MNRRKTKQVWVGATRMTVEIVREPKRMKQIGRKGKAWETCRAGLKTQFKAKGITSCEAGLPGCWHDNGLGFAHLKKRRFITTEEELREVCVLCNPCHAVFEDLAHSEMESRLRAIIAARPIPA